MLTNLQNLSLFVYADYPDHKIDDWLKVSLLDSIQQLRHLKKLCIMYNRKLDDTFFSSDSLLMSQFNGLEEIELDLERTLLSDKGISSLAKIISRCTKLTKIYLRFRIKEEKNSLEALIVSIAKVIKTRFVDIKIQRQSAGNKNLGNSIFSKYFECKDWKVCEI